MYLVACLFFVKCYLKKKKKKKKKEKRERERERDLIKYGYQRYV